MLVVVALDQAGTAMADVVQLALSGRPSTRWWRGAASGPGPAAPAGRGAEPRHCRRKDRGPGTVFHRAEGRVLDVGRLARAGRVMVREMLAFSAAVVGLMGSRATMGASDLALVPPGPAGAVPQWLVSRRSTDPMAGMWTRREGWVSSTLRQYLTGAAAATSGGRSAPRPFRGTAMSSSPRRQPPRRPSCGQMPSAASSVQSPAGPPTDRLPDAWS